jgi:hypothetical protein
VIRIQNVRLTSLSLGAAEQLKSKYRATFYLRQTVPQAVRRILLRGKL